MENLSMITPLYFHLLMHFYQPKNIDDFLADQWLILLDNKFNKTIDLLLQEGMITEAPLSAYLYRYYKMDNLKEIAENLKLKTGGKKTELIGRIIESHPNKLENYAAKHSMLFYISKTGKDKTEKYLAILADCFRQHNHGLIMLLLNQLLKAKERFYSFLKTMPSEYEFFEYDGFVLDGIFSKTPKYLSSLDENELQIIRMEAALSFFFKRKNQTILPNGFSISERLSNEVISRGLETHSQFVREIKAGKKSGAKFVTYFNCNDQFVCPHCRNLEDKKIPIDIAPELPLENCTCEFGCRCWISAHPSIFDE